jgi:hypothetical protein
MMMKPCQTLETESTQERERKTNKRQGSRSRDWFFGSEKPLILMKFSKI